MTCIGCRSRLSGGIKYGLGYTIMGSCVWWPDTKDNKAYKVDGKIVMFPTQCDTIDIKAVVDYFMVVMQQNPHIMNMDFPLIYGGLADVYADETCTSRGHIDMHLPAIVAEFLRRDELFLANIFYEGIVNWKSAYPLIERVVQVGNEDHIRELYRYVREADVELYMVYAIVHRVAIKPDDMKMFTWLPNRLAMLVYDFLHDRYPMSLLGCLDVFTSESYDLFTKTNKRLDLALCNIKRLTVKQFYSVIFNPSFGKFITKFILWAGTKDGKVCKAADAEVIMVAKRSRPCGKGCGCMLATNTSQLCKRYHMYLVSMLTQLPPFGTEQEHAKLVHDVSQVYLNREETLQVHKPNVLA